MNRSPALWVLSSRWHQGPLRGQLWLLAMLVCTLALLAAAVWQQRQHMALRQVQQDTQVGPRGAPFIEPGAAGSEQQADFARSLQPDAGLAVWVADFQRAAARLGVVLVAITDTPRAAQVDQLGRHDIQVTLRGSYPQIKLLLKETLDRHPSTTVARLNMRSVGSPADVEATLGLIRWHRPAVAGALAAASRPVR